MIMKKHKIIQILNSVILSIILISCTREEPLPIHSVNIRVNLPANFRTDVKFANKEVVLTSASNVYRFTTNAQGEVIVNDLIPDVYNIIAQWEMTGVEYKQLIANPEPLEDKATVLLNVALNNFKIFSDVNLTLNLEAVILKSLLISKIYYTGTKDNANKNYSTDNYIEIFNNSEETVFLDGKYLALTESMSPAAYPAKDNPDFIYARQICQFPGDGNDYPVLPSTSIVIATRSARDHRLSASTSVDLSNADFEVKDADGSGNPIIKALPIISNSIPALKVLNMLSGGGNGVFIFETNEDIFSWPEVYAPGKTSGERFRKVPVGVVLDGVECLKNNVGTGPDINLKRLPFVIDAGYTFVNTTSGYTHESLERKVIIRNGVLKLVDSNNSIEDFVIVLDPTPKKYDKPELNN
jgi:hypothetical protein